MTTETWRLLDTGCADGYTNMAIDEAILLSCARGLTPPTLRFYRWKPTCLSVGFFQSIEREVDVEECCRRGVDVVRRPTGGRAVLHDAEVTYSVAMGENHPLGCGSIPESHRKIGSVLSTGLRSMGIEAQMAPRLVRGLHDEQEGEVRRGRTPACFDVPSDYEITVEGRKLVGSAQARKHGGLLQHGSILLDVDLPTTLALLRLRREVPDVRLVQSLARRIVGLRQVLGRDVSHEHVVRAIVEGFKQCVGISFELGELTDEERLLAEQLRRDKYSAREWNYRR
ncbi:MAG: lipoate--protein ligase family protein [Chloroflexi bacterium]|nr:lipoate--protein ligase family protein [Chloroflexota bacterium]MDA8188140.1 biotin/lipoate A/B protein ligase family protein [Dehalococcoidales bacterium]